MNNSNAHNCDDVTRNAN